MWVLIKRLFSAVSAIACFIQHNLLPRNEHLLHHCHEPSVFPKQQSRKGFWYSGFRLARHKYFCLESRLNERVSSHVLLGVLYNISRHYNILSWLNIYFLSPFKKAAMIFAYKCGRAELPSGYQIRKMAKWEFKIWVSDWDLHTLNQTVGLSGRTDQAYMTISSFPTPFHFQLSATITVVQPQTSIIPSYPCRVPFMPLSCLPPFPFSLNPKRLFWDNRKFE